MKRPEQHETDSDADALFRATFSKWAITPSERDYGWDYIVEFFKEHESGRDSLGCITPKPPKCHPDVRVDGRLLGDWPQTDFSKTKLEPQVRFDEA